MLRKLTFIFILMSNFSHASEDILKTGLITELSHGTHDKGWACIKVDDTWFYFDTKKSDSEFLNSMALNAITNEIPVNAWSTTIGSSLTACSKIGSEGAIPLFVLQYK
jgi:hypothetical protein